jgi:hypothetical protein
VKQSKDILYKDKTTQVKQSKDILYIDKSFEKVKYSIKTQLRKVVTEKDRNKFKEKLSSYSDESKYGF